VVFEWDEDKNAANRRKHGVDFDEASASFYDPQALELFDPGHSDGEDRYIVFGISKKGRLLAVSCTFRGEAIRLISARKATKKEINAYEKRI